MEVLYSTKATADGGKTAKVRSEDGVLNFEIRPPLGITDDKGKYTNPEQIFAAGYAACFGSAISQVALEKKLRIRPIVTAKVDMGKNNSGGYQFAVHLDVIIEGISQQEAEDITEKAHYVCPYSNSTRNNIKVETTVSSKQK